MAKAINSVFLLLVVLLSASVSSAAVNPGCKDRNGKPVDWFIALKLPAGTNYAYTDSTSTSSLTIQSAELVDENTSPLWHTLRQIENVESKEYAALFWNDQPQDISVSSTFAHAKGVIGVGSTSGFLLVHSTPKFPVVENGKIQMIIQSGQQVYGQHYFCISTSASNIEKIAEAYTIDYPYVYSGNVPSSMTSSFPYLTKLSKNIRNNGAEKFSVNFSTLGGQAMTKFAKSGQWVVPFYDNVVADSLQISLFTETWGSPQEGADCDQTYKVLSNISVAFPGTNVAYQWTKDHSKYAISSDNSKPYVCLGDINRQSSQWKRGGGTVCFKNSAIHNSFSKIMTSHQSCDVGEQSSLFWRRLFKYLYQKFFKFFFGIPEELEILE